MYFARMELKKIIKIKIIFFAKNSENTHFSKFLKKSLQICIELLKCHHNTEGYL